MRLIFIGYQEYEHYPGQNTYPYPNPSYNYPEHPAATPSPSESPPQQPLPHDYLRKPGGYPSGFDEFDPSIIPHADHYRITPSPGVSIPHEIYGNNNISLSLL